MKHSKPRPVCAAGALMLATLAASAEANDLAFTPVFVNPFYKWSVSVDGATAQQNPPLLLIRGQTYTIHLSNLAPIHSFYIKTVSSIGAANAYGDFSGNGTTAAATITFTVPQTAPDTLFYNCGVHSSMAGMISVDGIFQNGFEPAPTM